MLPIRKENETSWLGESSLRRAREAGFGVRSKSAGEGRYPCQEEIAFLEVQ